MVNITKDFIRESVWLEAWISVSTSDSCLSKETATKWADACLEEYEKRFIKNKQEQNENLSTR